jgi:hypothetical protein
LHKLPQLEALSCLCTRLFISLGKAGAEAGRISLSAQAATAGGSKLPLYKIIFLGEAGAEAGRVSMAAQVATA